MEAKPHHAYQERTDLFSSEILFIEYKPCNNPYGVSDEDSGDEDFIVVHLVDGLKDTWLKIL